MRNEIYPVLAFTAGLLTLGLLYRGSRLRPREPTKGATGIKTPHVREFSPEGMLSPEFLEEVFRSKPQLPVKDLPDPEELPKVKGSSSRRGSSFRGSFPKASTSSAPSTPEPQIKEPMGTAGRD
jgi:hypothetical protein